MNIHRKANIAAIRENGLVFMRGIDHAGADAGGMYSNLRTVFFDFCSRRSERSLAVCVYDNRI
jgi:hypothetical protein